MMRHTQNVRVLCQTLVLGLRHSRAGGNDGEPQLHDGEPQFQAFTKHELFTQHAPQHTRHQNICRVLDTPEPTTTVTQLSPLHPLVPGHLLNPESQSLPTLLGRNPALQTARGRLTHQTITHPPDNHNGHGPQSPCPRFPEHSANIDHGIRDTPRHRR